MTNPPIPSRPYSKVRGSEPSVTTILGVKNTPGLDWAAAKLTAEHAVYEDEWKLDGRGVWLPEHEQIDNLRRYFKGIWNGRAYMGTLVHSVNEAWCNGDRFDIDALLQAHLPWNRNAELYDMKKLAALLYIQGLEQWWLDAQPTDILSEDCVRTPGKYVGTRDMVCTIDGERWLIDIKTTEQQDPEKGIYSDSWALQLAAYRYAQEVITYEWLHEDQKRGPVKPRLVVSTVEPNAPVDRCGVIHLRGNNKYDFYEVEASEQTYEVFYSLIPIYHWFKNCPPVTAISSLGGTR